MLAALLELILPESSRLDYFFGIEAGGSDIVVSDFFGRWNSSESHLFEETSFALGIRHFDWEGEAEVAFPRNVLQNIG